MRSLRSKFTLALLLTSLLSLAFASLVGRSILYREFNQFVMEDSFKRFRTEMTAYFETYGTWENGKNSEGFGEFERRRRPRMGRPPITSGLRGGNDGEGPPPQSRQGWRGDGPGEIAPQGAPGGEPNAIAEEKKRPPFHFMLTDPAGRILLGDDDSVGELAPEALRRLGKPIVVKGKTVAIAIPDPKPNLTRLDVSYLNAMRQAILYAVGAATILALSLGLIVGTRLNREIKGLTAAIQSVGDGDLRQEVAVNSRDEIGSLAAAFNRMSTDLARAHDELSESNEKIRKQAELLQEMAIRDKLTGLYNRRHFDEQAASTFAHAERYERPLTVMIGDIDFFKKINDTFSHAVGDEVLRRIGAILQSTTRESDLVARYGGEEFVIAFPETAAEPAAARCEILRQAVESYPWHEVHRDLRVTMSMGLDDDLSAGSFEKMLAAADAKLYVAKHSGRNRVCWNEDPTATVEVSIATSAVV